MSLRIQAQPPVPCSENVLATMPAMIGAPSSSWITVSVEKPAAALSISHPAVTSPLRKRPASDTPRYAWLLVTALAARLTNSSRGRRSSDAPAQTYAPARSLMRPAVH
jgi:hypothetical protein